MGSDAARLLEAADFAAWKHREQRRKDPEGTPYINHPIGARPLPSRCPSRDPCSEPPVPLPSGQPPYGGARGAGPRPPPSPPLPVSPVPGVARILSHEAGVTDVVVLQVPLRPGPRWGRRRLAGPDRPPAPPNSPRPPQAALLHDTVEDTDTTLPEIEERFGPEVRRVVEELTDDKTLPKAERKRLQVERAAGSSARAKLVKLADKLHNLRDLQRCAPKGAPGARPGPAPREPGAGSDAPRVSPQDGRRSACRSTSGGRRKWWPACAGRARRWRRRCSGCWRSAAWRWGRERGNKCGECHLASPS